MAQLSTMIPARLADTSYITDSATASITNAAGKVTVVTCIWLHNTHSAGLAVTLYRVPNNGANAGAAGAGNQFYLKTLGVNETVQIEIKSPGIVLSDTNDTIQAVAGTTNKVTISADGFTMDA